MSDTDIQRIRDFEATEIYWRSWAATRVMGFTFFGMALGASVSSLLWWAFS